MVVWSEESGKARVVGMAKKNLDKSLLPHASCYNNSLASSPDLRRSTAYGAERIINAVLNKQFLTTGEDRLCSSTKAITQWGMAGSSRGKRGVMCRSRSGEQGVGSWGSERKEVCSYCIAVTAVIRCRASGAGELACPVLPLELLIRGFWAFR